jgi:hypothetical protein
MKYLTLIFFCIALSPLKSQSVWLKGYVGMGREPRLQLFHNLEPNVYINYTDRNTSGIATPAIVLENKSGNFWELGFSWENRKASNNYTGMRVPPSDSIQSVDLGATTYKNFEAELAYNFAFKRNKDHRWKSFMGLAINPHRSAFDYTTHQSYLYSGQSSVTGVHWGLIPRIQYHLTKKLVVDFNAALFVVSTNYVHTRIENPALTERQQTNSIFEVDLLQQYWLRVGLAWKIWGRKKLSAER